MVVVVALAVVVVDVDGSVVVLLVVDVVVGAGHVDGGDTPQLLLGLGFWAFLHWSRMPCHLARHFFRSALYPCWMS